MNRGKLFLASLLVLAASAGSARAAEKNSYVATILAGNEADEDFHTTDPLLQNSWGLAASGSGPWWVANNGSNFSTLYNGAGDKQMLEVVVPDAPTGEVFYGGSLIHLSNDAAARFIWATESGTFWAWNGTLDPNSTPQHAEMILNDPGSIYKGLAVHGDVLYSTDFGSCEVEAFTGNPFAQTFAEIPTAGGFEDDTIPANYCPFGIQAVGDSIFVTYALKGGEDDIAGQGHGFVREFDTDGNLIAAVADHGQLNSPWGVAPAPSDFGRFGGCLLVGNFGDGTINAYCKDSEDEWHFGGTLRSGKRPLVIDGLWGIGFGNDHASGDHNVLYFAAGPDDEENGYFGKIEVGP
jgi:uncharacterized protein (TIGR03118 family)